MMVSHFKRAVALALGMIFASAATACAATASPRVADGFTMERIATVDGARELAVAPNGDLFVGTNGPNVYVVPHADATAGSPAVFASFDSQPAAGVALRSDTLFVGTQFGVYRVAYHTGDQHARTSPVKIATVRPSGISRDHVTTSVAYRDGIVYAGVGSSCNACRPELDDTRASIQQIDLKSGKMTPLAEHIRNAIALAVNPQTETLWAGVAGADDLPPGHPYEIFDAVTSHADPVDYGWPSCYENQKSFSKWSGSCANTPVPRVVMPAYETPIGAVFYPLDLKGAHAFPARYHGGAFITLHGSWHGPDSGLPGYVPPRVVFVPMHGDTPARSADWNDPATQWSEFVTGYQNGGTIQRTGRPTGIAVGPDGSLFIADDMTGAIYRVRPK